MNKQPNILVLGFAISLLFLIETACILLKRAFPEPAAPVEKDFHDCP